jgi:hypothetical protein
LKQYRLHESGSEVADYLNIYVVVFLLKFLHKNTFSIRAFSDWRYKDGLIAVTRSSRLKGRREGTLAEIFLYA